MTTRFFNIHITAVIICGFLSGCYFDAITPMQPTDYGLYQNFTSTELASSGDTVSGLLTGPNHAGWFVFSGIEDSTYKFTASCQYSLSVSVLPETKDTVLQSDIIYESSSSYAAWICPKSGRYCVTINPTTSVYTESISYTLYFATTDTLATGTGGTTVGDSYEPDGSYSSATLISADGTSQTHSIGYNDYDYFKFSALSGYTYRIETTGSLDTYIYLFSTDGFSILLTDDDGGDNSNALVSWPCDASGTYYFYVRGYSSSVYGSYQIAVTQY